MGGRIRRIRAQVPSIIVAGLALYFAASFIFAGAKTLLSLYLGTTDYVAMALAQALGYALGPSFAKVTTVAAAIGAAKLAVGGYFTLAVTERSRVALDGELQKDYGALDVALHGAVALAMFQVLSAWIVGDAAAVRMHAAHVMLICVTVSASMFEREAAARRAIRVGQRDATAEQRAWPDRPLPTDRSPLP